MGVTLRVSAKSKDIIDKGKTEVLEMRGSAPHFQYLHIPIILLGIALGAIMAVFQATAGNNYDRLKIIRKPTRGIRE